MKDNVAIMAGEAIDLKCSRSGHHTVGLEEDKQPASVFVTLTLEKEKVW